MPGDSHHFFATIVCGADIDELRAETYEWFALGATEAIIEHAFREFIYRALDDGEEDAPIYPPWVVLVKADYIVRVLSSPRQRLKDLALPSCRHFSFTFPDTGSVSREAGPPTM